MFIESERLLIRDLDIEDGMNFAEMASDGSLIDIGFDSNCKEWMDDWIKEARELAKRNNPQSGYLAYTIELKETNTVVGSIGCSYYEDLKQTGITYFIGNNYRCKGYAAESISAYSKFFLQNYDVKKIIATVREANVPSWRAIEKTGYTLTEKKMYKDINDDIEKMYRFYEYL